MRRWFSRYVYYEVALLADIEAMYARLELNRNALKLTNLHVLGEGGFWLTKFLRNRKEVLKAIPVENRVESTWSGLFWDAYTGKLYFSSAETNKPNTKRSISVMSSLFDPFGFLVPFILPINVLLQEFWRQKIGWDDDTSQR